MENKKWIDKKVGIRNGNNNLKSKNDKPPLN